MIGLAPPNRCQRPAPLYLAEARKGMCMKKSKITAGDIGPSLPCCSVIQVANGRISFNIRKFVHAYACLLIVVLSTLHINVAHAITPAMSYAVLHSFGD